MISFLGEHEVAIDTKSRFLLPSGFRKQLAAAGEGESFVVNRGIEKCITIYPVSVWNVMYERVTQLNDFNADDRTFKRLFLNGATPVELDTADRLLLPKQLLEYAGIKKDAVISAQGNKLEIWDKDTYYQYMDGNTGKYSELAEKVAKNLANPNNNKQIQ